MKCQTVTFCNIPKASGVRMTIPTADFTMDLLKKGNKAHLTTQYKYAHFHSGVQNVSVGGSAPVSGPPSPGPPKKRK